ncbi:MAG: FG-GAP repeat protein, partial [Tolypothrix sp. Co-bin9]|nr:FG-GAP repeat protein [Tolypothrix sp. Co-bin9]
MTAFSQAFVAYNGSFTVSDGGWTSFDKFPRQLGDINGDGRDDIVGFAGSEVYVALGQSNVSFSQSSLAYDGSFTVSDGGWTSFDEFPRQLGDI